VKRVALFRACLLLAGAGQLLYTTGDGERLALKLEGCDVALHAPAPTSGTARSYRLRWEGCGTLARELGTSGALLLAGSMRMPHRPEIERGDDERASDPPDNP
jgi:hypothetical protein